MQQIYNDRVEGFEKIIDKEFYKDNSLNRNWRSQKNIVTVLNSFYFDPAYKQEPTQNERENPNSILLRI